MNNKKFTIIGGDLRNIKLANLIAGEGNKVNIYGFKNAGFETGIKESEDLGLAIDESDVIIGPLPCSNDNETINSPFHPDRIYINEVFKTMNKNQLFIAGRIGEKISNLAQIYNVYSIDIWDREEMAVLNAIPIALPKGAHRVLVLALATLFSKMLDSISAGNNLILKSIAKATAI
ncbi:MAG: dipicolinate synthase subunit DpsA [Clostridiales bacterium]|nr:dipicolinate synthase subunit DpsA [Eubacteriales bacterium]MDH7565185.1 dipicolinate synthase subunit DpsA [Clostridiales bacterium]